MTTSTTLRRLLASTVSTALAASALLAASTAAEAADVPPATKGATIDYFDDVYSGLGPGSVLETVTVERFEYILKTKPGSFAFLVGDPGNASTQATIGHVDAVAKQLGVDKVYNFTPKLDGDTLDLWDLAGSGLRTGTSPDPAGSNRAGQGLAQYEALGNRLLADYLNKDTETQFSKDAATDPYLFVYDKDRTAGGQQDRIVAALSGAKTAADLDTAPEQQAYRAQVAQVLGSVDDLATNTQFEFNRDEHNRRHYERYVRSANPATEADNLARFGGDVFDAADAEDGFRIETITYPELLHLVEQPGDFPLLFGGTWCHNTAAIIKDTNRLAKEHGIKKVYNFDFSLTSTGNGGGDAFHIRDNALASEGKVIRPSHLYGDLVNGHFGNAVTQYRKNGDPGAGSPNFVAYHPGGDTSKPLAEARKIQVGHLLTFNKDRKDPLGEPQPVVDQAIRQNDDGGNTEHMTEWWFVKGRELAAGDPTLRGSNNPSSGTGSNSLQSQRAFAKEAVDEIDSILAGLAGERIPSTATVTGIGEEEIKLGDEPVITVSVDAEGYAPFISRNSANGSTAPNNGTGKPTGFVAVLDGDEEVTRARLKRDGTATLTLTGLTAGAQDLTVRYLGRGDLVEPSQRSLTFDVTGDPSATTLVAPSSLVFGAGGTATATVAEGATGTVELEGLPGDPLTATIVDDTATFDLPASTPAGPYELSARYGGDDTYGVSTSEAAELAVSRAPTTVTSTVAAKPYGAASSITATVAGPDGQVPGGSVTVTVSGQAYPGTLSDGRATVVLPKTLAPKKYAVTVVYGGSPNLVASSTTTSVTVGKGQAKAPVFKATGKVKATGKGKATVTVGAASGLAKTTGSVRVVLSKGKSTKTVTATVKSGKASLTLPKIAAGTWTVKTTYRGDARYAAGKTVSSKLAVAKK